MADSPDDVPIEVLVEAERLSQIVADRLRVERGLPPARRLTASEAEAIEGPPFDVD